MPNDISNEQLSRGLWFVEHKLALKRGLTIFLIVLDVILVGYGGFGFGDWFFGSGVRERAQIALLTTNLTDYRAFRQAAAPRDVAIEDTTVLRSGTDRFDSFARATNSNARWWVEFDYTFAGSVAQHGFLLPGEAKYLRALGVVATSAPAATRPEISNLRWHRVNPHVVQPDYPTWSGLRLALEVNDIVFSPPEEGSTVPVSRVTFKVHNATAFGYRTVGFFVRLMAGSRTVGVSYVTISSLQPGETREVVASWFDDLASVSRVEVQSEVNIFDVQSYLPL